MDFTTQDSLGNREVIHDITQLISSLFSHFEYNYGYMISQYLFCTTFNIGLMTLT